MQLNRILSLLAALWISSGCARMEDEGTSSGAKSEAASPQTGTPEIVGTIGISLMTTENPFFVEISDAAREEAKKHGYKLISVSGNEDPATQARQVKDFIVKKVSAIILTPCSAQSVGAAIKEANAAGIPVFTADTGCLDKTAKVVCHVATDNYNGGKQAGEAMIEALRGKGGEILILDYKVAESCLQRVKGFKEVIDRHNRNHPDASIDIVSELPGGGSRPMGFRSATDALQGHPDIVGIFAINDPSALGARGAVEKAGKEDEIKIIGFDGQREGKIAIRDGKIYADPIQFPKRMGRVTVQKIVDYLEGKEVEKEIIIPTSLYRQADGLADPDLKSS